MNIWRNADANDLKECHNKNILTFDWFNGNVNYKSSYIENMEGDGKRCIRRWVTEMKKHDLIFLISKYEYYGVCYVKSEYNFKKTYIFNDKEIKPIINVEFLDFRKPIAHNFNIRKVAPDTFAEINQDGFNYEMVLDFIKKMDYDLYTKILNYVAEQSPDKISRICWNKNSWLYPSGKDGKSLYKGSYEFQNGYGHEEWIANNKRVVNGYCYSFLQSIAKYRNTYKGKTFNIYLYSINCATNERFLIGKINNTIIVSENESEDTYNIFKKNGFIDEMEKDIEIVSGNVNSFKKTNKDIFFNVKFLPEDIEIYDTPQLILNHEEFLQNNQRYQLLNKVGEPSLESSFDKKFAFKIGLNIGKGKTKGKSSGEEYEIILFHNEIKKIVYDQLNSKYKDCVGAENNTGYGTKIDIVRKDKNSYIFYEIKIAHNIKIAIRDALSQLMEYCYYPDKNNANKLIIISHHPISDECKKYLSKLRRDFNIPIWYQYYNPEKMELEANLY